MAQNALRILKILAPFLMIYGGICLVLALLQRSMIYFPTPLTNTTCQFIELPQDDVTLRISVYPHLGRRAVIYFGGNAEDVSYSLLELSKVFPESAVYAMHYRGYSGSTGTPSEAALHSDAKALYDRVKRDHSEIIVVGRSLGSGLAVPLADSSDVYRLILVTPFDSMVNVAKYHYPLLPVHLLLVDRYESQHIAPRLTIPTLVLIAENDFVVPRKCAMNLVNSFQQGICQSLVLPYTDHNSLTLPAAIVQQFISHPTSMVLGQDLGHVSPTPQ